MKSTQIDYFFHQWLKDIIGIYPYLYLISKFDCSGSIKFNSPKFKVIFYLT